MEELFFVCAEFVVVGFDGFRKLGVDVLVVDYDVEVFEGLDGCGRF